MAAELEAMPEDEVPYNVFPGVDIKGVGAQGLVSAAAAAFSASPYPQGQSLVRQAAEVAGGAKRAGRKARPIPLGPATDIDSK